MTKPLKLGLYAAAAAFLPFVPGIVLSCSSSFCQHFGAVIISVAITIKALLDDYQKTGEPK